MSLSRLSSSFVQSISRSKVRLSPLTTLASRPLQSRASSTLTLVNPSKRQNNNNYQSFWKQSSLFFIPAALLASYTLSSADAADSSAPSLSPAEFRSFRLKKVIPYNHDTKTYIFDVKEPHMPITSFILVKAIVDGKEEIRPYTPIETHTPNELHLLIKSYPNGKVSKHFGSLKEGDSIEIKGPLPKLDYKPNMKKEIGAIAGGTGITPIFQLLEHIMMNTNDNTKFTLLFANKSKSDILLQEKLTVYSKLKPGKFRVIYLLDKEEPGWKGPTGFVSEELIEKYMPKPSNDSLVVVCGPPPMMKLVSGPKAKDFSQGEVDGLLKSLGYTKDQVFKF